MRIERRDGYRVVVGGPVPPQADAITLGNAIFVRQRAADDDGLMAHELVHVRQFRDLGFVPFMAKYLGAYLRYRLGGYGHMAAYRRIPLEVEASWVSRLQGIDDLESVLAPGRSTRTRRRSVFAPGPGPLRGALRGTVQRTGFGLRTRSRSRPDIDVVRAAMAVRPAGERAPEHVSMETSRSRS